MKKIKKKICKSKCVFNKKGRCDIKKLKANGKCRFEFKIREDVEWEKMIEQVFIVPTDILLEELRFRIEGEVENESIQNCRRV